MKLYLNEQKVFSGCQLHIFPQIVHKYPVFTGRKTDVFANNPFQENCRKRLVVSFYFSWCLGSLSVKGVLKKSI